MVSGSQASGTVPGPRSWLGPLLPAEACHAEAMAVVHAAAFDGPGEVWTAAAFTTQLALPGVFGFMAEAGGLVLARVAGDDAEILTLGVAWPVRRRRLGRALLDAAEAEAGRREATAMFLEVSERNAPARALYAAGGYAEAGRRRRYYPDGSDALVLRCVLAAA